MTKEELIWAYHTTPDIFAEIYAKNIDEPFYTETVEKYFKIIIECLSKEMRERGIKK